MKKTELIACGVVCVICIIIFAIFSHTNHEEWVMYRKFMAEVWKLWFLLPIPVVFTILSSAFLGVFAIISGHGSLGVSLLALAVFLFVIVLVMGVYLWAGLKKLAAKIDKRRKEKEAAKKKAGKK